LNACPRVENLCLRKFEEAGDNRVPECDAASSSEAWSFKRKNCSWHCRAVRERSPNRLRSSAAARPVAALMGGVCQALCLYIRLFPYLRPPSPNACWVGEDGLTSCAPLCLEGQLAPGCASRASVPSVPGFSSTSPILDHWTTGPHPSRAHDASMESLARLTDLCQAAGPAAAASTGSGGAREVHPSPVTHIFPPTRPRFSNLHSSHQQNGEANDENLLDRSGIGMS
jgi:hypothetical protein